MSQVSAWFLACEFRHVGFWHVGFWLATQVLFATRMARDLRPWISMDECAMPSGLAELGQLHVEPNSEHSTSLHCSSTNCRHWKAGWGLETRQGMSEWRHQGLQCSSSHMWSPTVSIVNISVPHSQTHTHSQAHGQATPTHAPREAWCELVIPSKLVISDCTVAYCLHGLNITLPVFSLALLAANSNPPTPSREWASLSQDISDPCIRHPSMKRLAVMRSFSSSPSSFPILPQSGYSIPASRRAHCIVSPFSTSPAARQSVLPYLMANDRTCVIQQCTFCLEQTEFSRKCLGGRV